MEKEIIALTTMCKVCGHRVVSKYDPDLCERCRHCVIKAHNKALYGTNKYPLGWALAVGERYVRLKMVERTATLRHENNKLRRANEKMKKELEFLYQISTENGMGER